MFRKSRVTAICFSLSFLFLASCGSADQNESASSLAPASALHFQETLTPSFNKQALASRFAPILRLHPQELYVPMDPEEFLNRAEDERDEEFFLSSRKDYLNGHQGRTIVNVSSDGRYIQYWVFSPKNGCQGAKLRYRVQGPIKIGELGETNRTLELCNISIHEGDWENITLKLSSDLNRVEAAYLSAHGHGNWLPASALEFRGERLYVYSALNSHAFYAKDIGFHPETTIAHMALDGFLGIDWFQIGDIISEEARVQKNPEGGARAIEFDSQKALVDYNDIGNLHMKTFDESWGRSVNARDVMDLPELSFGPIEGILKLALKVALDMVPELKTQSGGGAPPSPWVRVEWRGFDDFAGLKNGLAYDRRSGGDGGLAFTDSEKLKKASQFKVREIVIKSGDRVDRVCINLDEVGEICHGGGGGGGEKRLILESDEYIVEQGVSIGKKGKERSIFAIKFTTNKGRTLEGGSWTPEAVWLSPPAGMQLVGWYGSSGSEVDSLGPIWGMPTL